MTEALVGVRDLFFREKINETAGQSDVSVLFAMPSELEKLTTQEKPRLIILDLEEEPQEYLTLIPKLKALQINSTPKIIGYLSHVNITLREQAAQAGCDAVIPRSVFSRDLPRILKDNHKQDD